ncbi:MAG: isopenicillin N synthase family dioxygenase [Burkholderiales bacterium]|jgi:isopenicillin N synthase-like dioxygenase
MTGTTKAIPIVDLSGDADALVRAIVAACTDTGFFGVTGHGVPAATLAGAFGAARAFFALPVQEKTRVRRPRPELNRGWIAPGTETLARLAGRETPPDFKEVFTVGPQTFDDDDPYYTCEAARPHWGANPWPARPEGFRDAVLAYQREMQRLTGRLMALFCRALGVPEDHLAMRSTRAPSQLRLIHYPPYDGPWLPGQLRAGEHTDLSLLTIVASDNNAVGGLEVRDRDGDWVAAPDFDGFMVNIGDTMMRWCNDRWVSTPHRVANPPPEAGARSDRLSLAYFHIVDYDAVIECLPSCVDAAHPARYAPITMGEYRASRFARTANAGG